MDRLLEEYWGLAGRAAPAIDVAHDVDVLPSRLAATELAVGSVAAAATSAAHLAAVRGVPSRALVDGRLVSAAFRSDRLLRIDGLPIEGFAELSRFWRAGDGWVRTHGNYPHHREALLAALGLTATAGADDVARVIATRDRREVEEAIAAANGIGVAVRTEQEWRQHPQDAAVRELPLMSSTRLADAPSRTPPPMPAQPLLPASGLRVLDLTRVIAGPVATRTLALLGADVLRLDAPSLPEIPWQHLDTGMGKRSALLDLTTDHDMFETLLADADVVVTGYRPGALDRHGLGPATLAERRPGLVVATLSAWAGVGPWGHRRGFDSIVQAATGIAMAESADGETPGALPAQALDHATGYLLAGGILVAVADQIEHGGSIHVSAHLARTAAWLLDHPDPTSRRLPDVEHLLCRRETPSGALTYAAPAVRIEGGPGDWAIVGAPWASGRPEWQ